MDKYIMIKATKLLKLLLPRLNKILREDGYTTASFEMGENCNNKYICKLKLNKGLELSRLIDDPGNLSQEDQDQLLINRFQWLSTVKKIDSELSKYYNNDGGMRSSFRTLNLLPEFIFNKINLNDFK